MLTRLTAMGLTLAATVFFAFPSAEHGESMTLSPQETASDVETFRVDPVHSSMVFRIKHNGVAYFYGRFNQISGTIDWNESDPSASSLAIEIATASVDTANERRDNHLRSDDFFSAAENPTISFRTSSIEPDGEKLKATGDLTLNGVTKPITVDLEHTGSAEGRGAQLIGLHATFTIKRTDFDMPYGVENGALGDEVLLMIGIEAGRRISEGRISEE